VAKLADVMIYALGPFRLDTQDNLLFRGSEPLALGRRALALLRALVELPGALVSKDALIEAAWPGQAVEESNLTVQIAALRKVLGEVPGGDRWIETMPRRGYRFIAPVVEEDANGITPSPIDATQVQAPRACAEAERRQITAMSCELVGTSDPLTASALTTCATQSQRFSVALQKRSGGTAGSWSTSSAMPRSSSLAIRWRRNMTPSKRSALGLPYARRSAPRDLARMRRR
jgi:DNA-binding winged helix-turn-helix (wHTH) protein